jgi:O-antigen/teichoic acid export membrane protein
VLLRPVSRVAFDWPVLAYHFRYGRQIMATGVTRYICDHADNWFVGRVFGEASLGLYQRAYQFGNLPTTQITGVMQRVLFPAYSKLQHDPARLHQAVSEVQAVLAMLIAPVSVALFFFADAFVLTLLGPKWAGMIAPFKVLVVWGGVRAFYVSLESFYRAAGRPIIVAYATTGRILILLLLLWPASRWGLVGVASVVLLTAAIEFPILVFLARRELGTDPSVFLRPLLPPAVIAILAGWISYLLLADGSTAARLFGGGAMTVIGYITVMLVIDRLFSLGYVTSVRRRLLSLSPAKVS